MWSAFPLQAVCLAGLCRSIMRCVKPDCTSSSSCPRALCLYKLSSLKLHARLFFRFYEAFHASPFILSGIPSSTSLTPHIHAHVYVHTCTHRAFLLINSYSSPRNPVKCHFPRGSRPHLPGWIKTGRVSWFSVLHTIPFILLAYNLHVTYCIYLSPHWMAGDLSVESVFYLCVFGTRWSVFHIVDIKRKKSNG